MWRLDLFILLSASVANLSIGLLSFLKNYRNLTHKLFALLTVSLVGWTSANYISIISISSRNLDIAFGAIQAILLFVVLQNTLFYLFVSAYPGNVLTITKKTARFYLIFSTATLLLGLFPGFFESYAISGDSISPKPSPFIVLFMAHTLFSTGAGLVYLVHRYRQTKGLARNQFKFLVFAGSVLLVVTPFTNFLLPVAFDINFFIPFGPLYTLAFASLIAYSMVKHKLFDFRLLVAKAFGYVLTIGFLSAVYGAAIFGVSSLLFNFEEITTTVQITYTLLAILLSFSFQPIKRFFDRLSNRFFFQDSYESQEFLDKLNRVLVARVDLQPLLKEAADLIVENLKAEYCVFVIRQTSYFDERIIGTTAIKLSNEDIALMHETIPKIHHRVIDSDLLTDDDSGLKQLMTKYDVSLLARLVTTVRLDVEGIGYLMLGQKRNGNPYTQQDQDVMRIIATEFVIAIQNALRFEEIEEFNATLQEKVDDATRQLRKTNEKLKALDETKDEFISMASHQLRTPLTSVKGYLSMVLEGDAGKVSEMQQKLLGQAFISSQRMVYLIADLLNLSRLRTGKFVIEAGPSNLAEVVEGEVGQLMDAAASRNLTLSFAKPPDFPTLMLDETKLRQVVMNFIDNAIYYTPSGGKIEIGVAETPQTIEFTVHDNGIGVPKAEQQHLFNKFYRAGNARKARPDGTGLGLFMAKKVIAAQGGAIIFKSEEGKGSTFGFTIAKDKIALQDIDKIEEKTAQA